MEPIKNVENIPGMTAAMKRWETELDSIDKEADPNDPNSLSAFILKADGELETLINGYHHDQPTEELDIDQIPDMKKQAERGFYDAKEKLYQINQEYWGGNFDPQTVQDVLHDYAQGYYAYVNLCVGGSPATVVDRWNAVNEGDQVNCLQLVTSQVDFKQQASMSFVPRHVTQGLSETNQSVSITLNYSPNNDLRRVVELAGYTDFYSQLGGRIGYQRKIGRSNWPDWLGRMGPLAEVGFSQVRGDYENRGSHLNQYDLRVGWQQPLYGYRFKKSQFGASLFVSPKVGIAYDQTWLDFGRGFPLEKEQAWMGLTEVTGGIEFDRNRLLSIFIAGGYFYDRSLSISGPNLQPFLNQGFILAIGGSGDLQKEGAK